jgi:cation:H+ antiporter
MTIVLLLVGLGLIVLGADWLVEGASSIARKAGVSEFVIGLTIVGMGTSAPEMVVSFIGAAQGNADIAIGNVVGSNIFNTLLILGLTATICPLQISGITTVDIATMMVSVVLVWLFSFTRYTVERWEGALLTLLFAGYMAWLLYHL